MKVKMKQYIYKLFIIVFKIIFNYAQIINFVHILFVMLNEYILFFSWFLYCAIDKIFFSLFNDSIYVNSQRLFYFLKLCLMEDQYALHDLQ